MKQTTILCLIILVASIPTKGERRKVDLKFDFEKYVRDGVLPDQLGYVAGLITIEVQKIAYSFVQLVKPLTWNEAYNVAKAMGSNLVTITGNPEVENVIATLFKLASDAGIDSKEAWVGDKGSREDTHVVVRWDTVTGGIVYDSLGLIQTVEACIIQGDTPDEAH